MKIHVQSYPDKVALSTAAIDALSSAITATAGARVPGAIMLSGGSTPRAVYEAIAASPLLAPDTLSLFMSDERLVPHDSGKNNFHNTTPMFESLGLPAERLLRVKTHLEAAEAAADYHRQIEDLLRKRTAISLGFLGMGADGHTASLFSDDDLARGKGLLARPAQAGAASRIPGCRTGQGGDGPGDAQRPPVHSRRTGNSTLSIGRTVVYC